MKPAIATLGAGLLGLALSAACGGDEFVVSDGGAGSAGSAGGGGISGTSGQAGQAGQSGAAGSAAGSAGSAAGSAGSAGQAMVCQKGEVTCAGGCLPLESIKTDVNNCGGCQAKCTAPRGLVPGCVKGECQLSCPAETTLCGVGCFDTKTDPNHCGDCGTQCTAPTGGKAECVNGKCDFSCTGTTTRCGDSCVDTLSSVTNCGSCGNSCEGEVCDQGKCALSCSGDAILCDNGCVDLLTSSDHCGECNNACSPLLGGGQSACVAGKCEDTCPPGKDACGGSCVDLLGDPQNCGACGQACKNPDDSEGTCNNGVCKQLCSDGQVDCNGECADLQTDASHCGSCEVSCTDGRSCLDGVCGVDCPAPNELCGDSCVDTQTTLQHCGGCGQACKMGSPSSVNDKLDCVGGSCVALCSGDRIACERDGDIFCHLLSSPQYCGGDCKSCDPGQACNGKECVPLPCPLDQINCNGKCVDLRTDHDNCGGCDEKCGDWQGCFKGSCKGGGEILANCTFNNNFILCGPQGEVYCTNKLTDSRHCGDCNNPCTNEQTCVSGQCVPLVLAAEDWECKPLGLTPCKLPGNKLVCVPGMACPN